ncbi:MAG TPA: tetratricopeptide repeat protein, partial [Acidobacteriaceae bacterium]|nr:tetratricopeptide repeat protein [Acidobacteriaceae bacterium]
MLTWREADLDDDRKDCPAFMLSRVNAGRYSFILAGLLLVGLCLGAAAHGQPGKAQTPADRDLAAAQGDILNRQFTKAIKLLQKSLKRFPEDNRLRVTLGRAYLYRGKTGLAIRQFRQALRHDPHDRLASLELARALADRRDYKASSQIYGELLATNAGDEAAAIGLTNNLMHQKQATAALRVANRGLAHHPDSLVLQEYKDRIRQGEFGGDEGASARRANNLQAGSS